VPDRHDKNQLLGCLHRSWPTPALAEISIFRGGPFYQAQQAAGLVNANRWNLVRRISLLTAVGWLPLFLITICLNRSGLHSLLTDYRVYVRLLIAIPALFVGESLMDGRFRAVFAYIRQAVILEASDMASMDDVIAKLAHLRDAYFPELVILVLAYVRTFTSYRGLIDPTPWLALATGANLRLTLAGWYAVLVIVPIWNFLLGLGLWRWILWTLFAFRLSRRDLKLVATHPDKHGGLGFLGLTASAFAPIALSAASVIGATWRQDILHHGAHMMDFKLPAIGLIVIIALAALGPLLFFVPRLAALRRTGVMEYGILGQIQGTEFHKKWILHRAGDEAKFLQAPESNSLFAYGQIFERIKELNAFPADTGSLYTLAAADLGMQFIRIAL
jgi:hypothetical protein